MKSKQILPILSLLLLGCNPQPEINNLTDLDGDQIFDLSLSEPENYLVSHYIPFPTELEKETPVIICAHGYSASTFEWDELREWADSLGGFHVSQVLLGGHGRSYADFKAATWDDWQGSIREEYEALDAKGFKNIWLVGSSTGAPLMVQLFVSDFFSNKVAPKGVFLIDPIVVSSNKTLTMVGLLGPVLGYTTTTLDPGEMGKWYTYRPQESLKQLMSLIDQTRKDLQKGILLTPNTSMKVFKTIQDDAADPASAVLLYKGIKTSNEGKIEIEMVESNLHVFTRLRGREGVTSLQVDQQTAAFRDMINKMTAD